MTTNTNNSLHRKGLWAALISSALLLFSNVFLYASFSVYSSSPEEFEVSYLDMLGSEFWVLALILLGLLLPGLILKPAHARRWIAFIFVLGVLTWFQAGFLLWDYGVFDGRDFSWDQYDIYGWLDITLWLTLLWVSIRFAGRILPLVVMVSWILILGQGVLAYTRAENTDGELKKDHVYSYELPEAFLDLSSNQNIIHFVLDSFQTDVFLQLAEESDLKDEFSGFTLFYDNAAIAPHTSFAIPAIFSGQLYDGKQTPADYYQTSILNGFQNTLFEKGYVVNLIPKMSMRSASYSNYFRVSTHYRGTVDDLKLQNTAQLIDVALFRVSPHFLRKKIFDGGNWFLVSLFGRETNVMSIVEKAFLKDYIEGLRVGTDKPAYHFIHIKPPHPPYNTLRDGSYAGEILPNTRENFVNESRPVIDLMRQYVKKLKQLGVYDDALIILQGDHGSQINPQIDGQEVKVCLRRLATLLAVKAPGSTGDMKISKTQTSILDIAPTVLNYAGEDTTSVFELDPDAQRQRPFLIVDSRANETKVSYYTVNGSVFDPQSCRQEKHLTVAVEKPAYEFGTKIQFGMVGNGDTFMDSGWSTCDARFCWSNGRQSSVKIPIETTGHDLDMQIRLLPFVIKPQVPRQRIRVLVNGVQLAEWEGTERKPRNFSVRVPAQYVTTRELQIGFEFPDAAIPSELDIGGDRRMLGAGLVSLRLDVVQNK